MSLLRSILRVTLPAILLASGLPSSSVLRAAGVPVSPPRTPSNDREAAPSKILVAHEPTLLVVIDGEPRLQPVEGSSLVRIGNTPSAILFDPSERAWFLASGDFWYRSSAATGPYEPVAAPPAEVAKVAERTKRTETDAPSDGLAEEAARPPEPGRPPKLLVTTEPAELLSFDGVPDFLEIDGAPEVLYAGNTDESVLLDLASQRTFVLFAGRWLAARSLEGPWAFVPPDHLPPSFATIPAGSPVAEALALGTGTEDTETADLDAEAPPQSVETAAAAGRPRVAYAFTVVAPRSVSRSQLVARAILEARLAPCPDIVVRRWNGSSRRVRMRPLPVPDGTLGFDGITVCRAPLPTGIAGASVDGLRLPLLPEGTPRRIAVLGDSGCRIKEYAPVPPATEPTYQIQDCNDPDAFPLRKISREIAAARPDLVVDTGDFFYRESNCPEGPPYSWMCGGSPPVNPPGSPNEDTWAGWEADWFAPAHALFQAAPLVLARGNHETCARGGTGFFHLLEPGVSPPRACQLDTTAGGDAASQTAALAQPTWVARLGEIDLVMLDSSGENDSAVQNADLFASLGRRATALLRRRGATGWLLTHAPVYAWQRFGGPSKAPTWTGLTMQAVLDPLLRPFDVIWSGHLHLFQTVQIPGRPAQLVFGDGGTLLDDSSHGGELPTFGPLTDPKTGGPLLGPDGKPVAPGVDPVPPPTRGVLTYTFGWALFKPEPGLGRFAGTRFEAGKGPWARCSVRPRSVNCTQVDGTP